MAAFYQVCTGSPPGSCSCRWRGEDSNEGEKMREGESWHNYSPVITLVKLSVAGMNKDLHSSHLEKTRK